MGNYDDDVMVDTLIENVRVHYNHNFYELLDILSGEVEEPNEFLDGILFALKIIENQEEINLYQIVFTNKEIKPNKLGHLFTQDSDEFDEERIGLEYENKKQRGLKPDDYFVVKISTPTSNIDFEKTLAVNVDNPWESEVVIKDPGLVTILTIE